MSFNSLGQYSASHKVWDHVGNIIAPVEASEGQRPYGEFMPASWLPVQFYEKYYENWLVITPGKIVALDNDGRVVPAQYSLGSATIVYGTNDVEAGVIDVRTGIALVTGDVGTVNVSDVTDFMGRGTSTALAISHPVGVCQYPVLQWAGDGSDDDDGFNPAGYRKHNYNMQHRVAFVCDYVLELPMVPAVASSETITAQSWSSSIMTFDALNNLPVATNTARTVITFANNSLSDASTVFVYQKATAAEVTAAGDWHIVYATGVITAFRATDPSSGTYSVTYRHYASAPSGSNVSKFACVLGDIKPGDFLKCNADSNWVVATPKVNGDGVTDDFDTNTVIMGQVLDIEVQPKDMLDKVRTAYSSLSTDATGSFPGGATSGQMDQMPGSATGGVSDKIHYAGAADKVCRVNLISR
jgi:hypothetical protein